MGRWFYSKLRENEFLGIDHFYEKATQTQFVTKIIERK